MRCWRNNLQKHNVDKKTSENAKIFISDAFFLLFHMSKLKKCIGIHKKFHFRCFLSCFLSVRPQKMHRSLQKTLIPMLFILLSSYSTAKNASENAKIFISDAFLFYCVFSTLTPIFPIRISSLALNSSPVSQRGRFISTHHAHSHPI